jgi:hypothetical protein
LASLVNLETPYRRSSIESGHYRFRGNQVYRSAAWPVMRQAVKFAHVPRPNHLHVQRNNGPIPTPFDPGDWQWTSTRGTC